MKIGIKYLLTIVTGLLLFFGCKDSEDLPIENNQTKEVTIGALLSLTGNWSTLGVTSKAALELAVDEINNKFLQDGTKLKINLKIVDTQLNPDIAYTETQKLISDGVEIIIGPQSSAELTRIKPLLDGNNIFAVSMGSTAGSLALSDDHVLRFCPDDKPEGAGIAKLMWERGIRKVVAVYREDDGNIGLKKSMTNSFTALGGTVIDSIKYHADDNITSGLISLISSSVSSANDQSATAVYLAGFDEVADIFVMSESDNVLLNTLWFGSNGSAMSMVLISNTDAARFANNVEFCSPLFAMSSENQNDWGTLSESILQSTQQEPGAYTFAAYDAIKVAAAAYKSAGPDYQFSKLLTEYINISAEYNGLTGLTELNEAGDRKYGNFNLLGICGTYPNYEWKSTGSYNAATDMFIYTGCN